MALRSGRLPAERGLHEAVGKLSLEFWVAATRQNLTLYVQIESVNTAIDLVERSGAHVKRNIALRRVSPEDDKMFSDIIGRYSLP